MSHLHSYFVRVASAVRKQLLLTLVIIMIAFQLSSAPAQATAIYEIPTVSAGVPTWIVDKADI